MAWWDRFSENGRLGEAAKAVTDRLEEIEEAVGTPRLEGLIGDRPQSTRAQRVNAITDVVSDGLPRRVRDGLEGNSAVRPDGSAYSLRFGWANLALPKPVADFIEHGWGDEPE